MTSSRFLIVLLDGPRRALHQRRQTLFDCTLGRLGALGPTEDVGHLPHNVPDGHGFVVLRVGEERVDAAQDRGLALGAAQQTEGRSGRRDEPPPAGLAAHDATDHRRGLWTARGTPGRETSWRLAGHVFLRRQATKIFDKRNIFDERKLKTKFETAGSVKNKKKSLWRLMFPCFTDPPNPKTFRVKSLRIKAVSNS